MVIDWERLAVISGKGFLLILEYFVKLSALVVTAVVLSAGGTFGVKLGNGFSSLSAGLRNVFGTPSDISGLFSQLRQYNADAGSFIWEPGGYEAMNSIFGYLNGAVLYLDAVANNFSNQPFATFFAAVTAFVSLYVTARLLRFYRQQGQGSRLVLLEQKLGERIFRKPVELQKRPVPKTTTQTVEAAEKEQQVRPRSGKPTFSSGSENQYLQDYIRLAQNGGN
jgi:hypothetical protein